MLFYIHYVGVCSSQTLDIRLKLNDINKLFIDTMDYCLTQFAGEVSVAAVLRNETGVPEVNRKKQPAAELQTVRVGWVGVGFGPAPSTQI